MKHKAILCPLMLGAAMLAGPALADRSVASGQFSDSDPKTVRLNQNCGGATGGLGYQIIGPLTASASGTYKVQDSGNTFFSQDTVMTFFDRVPDVNNLGMGQVGTVDDNEEVDLQAGTDYYAFVQPYCDLRTDINGVWAQHFFGPGLVTGEQTVASEDWWGGEWTPDDPLASIPHPFVDDCPETYYDVSGPQRFERSGVHFMSTTSGYDEQYMVIHLYDAPFNPNAPLQNRITTLFGGPFLLEKNKDYYFVVQPDCDVNTGDWYFVIWPPGPFQFNQGLAGTYSVGPNGHGILLDVDPFQNNVVFGAWFTWESGAAATESRTQAVGNPDQRWLTLIGFYEEGTSGLDVTLYSAEGGSFTTPATDTAVPAGTGRLEMEDCREGTLSFDLDDGTSETRTLSRNLLNGNTGYCYNLAAQPAVLYE